MSDVDAMRARTVPAPLTQVPNALTILRLIAVPIFAILLYQQDGEGSWVLAAFFAAIALTDQLDGFLARRWQVESEFGKFADPLADRLLIDATVIILWLDGRLQFIAVVIILGRDLLLILGYGTIRDRGYDFAVNRLGKWATFVLYAGVCGIIASDKGIDWPLWLFWIGIALALAAGALYGFKAFRDVKGSNMKS